MLDAEHQQMIAVEVSSAMDGIRMAAAGFDAPHVLMRPSLKIDGNKWCALYGENLQDGVAGFGDSPADAMADFDRAWSEPLTQAAAESEGQ